MNVFDGFYRGMSPDDWERFAADVLADIGYDILTYPARGPDGGQDFLVRHDSTTFIVSCKHLLGSGRTVGLPDENSILERMIQHRADGFIGFYSTFMSAGLSSRIRELESAGHNIRIYDNNAISNHIPRVRTEILQKFGSPIGVAYPTNVSDHAYVPLLCLGCRVDILQDRMIKDSLALIRVNANNQLDYLYGCKACFSCIDGTPWIGVDQSLHLDQFNGWRRLVDDELERFSASSLFYKNRSDFESKVHQRSFPSNWGRFL